MLFFNYYNNRHSDYYGPGYDDGFWAGSVCVTLTLTGIYAVYYVNNKMLTAHWICNLFGIIIHANINIERVP